MNHSPFSFNRLGNGVKWLIVLNGIVFIVQRFSGGWFEAIFGLIPYKVWSDLSLWRLFTYLFLHGSFFHLLFNMFTLWMFGKELENSWGTKEFLKFYFFCGLGAGVINTICEPFSVLTIIGASGAIYGVLVAYALLYPNSVIYLYAIVPVKAKQFVIFMALFEFFASSDGVPGPIARIAHLGGMAVGYLYLKSYEFRSLLNRLFFRISNLIFVRESEKKEEERTGKNLTEEVDEILEKVLLHGVESLTEKEREILRRYSQKH